MQNINEAVNHLCEVYGSIRELKTLANPDSLGWGESDQVWRCADAIQLKVESAINILQPTTETNDHGIEPTEN